MAYTPEWSMLSASQPQQSFMPSFNGLPMSFQEQLQSWLNPQQPMVPSAPAPRQVVTPQMAMQAQGIVPAPAGGTTLPQGMIGAAGATTSAPAAGYAPPGAPNTLFPNIAAGAYGLNSLAQAGLGLYSIWNANRAFNFQKDFAEKNMANSTASYNSQMEDKIRARYGVTGLDPQHKAAVDAKVAEKMLK